MPDKIALSEIPDLTDRERLIIQAAANLAADLAVDRMTKNFYEQVGRSFITRGLILLGAVLVGFGVAHGWIKMP